MLTNPRVLITLLLVALVAMTPLTTSMAEEGGGWGDFYDADGNLLPGVIQGGETTMPAEWMPSFPDWSGLGDVDATFHVLTAESGATLLVPSATTLFFMAMNPVESGLTGSDGLLGTGGAAAGLIGAGMIVGGHTTLSDFVAALTGMSQVDANQFADAALAGNGNVWSLLNPLESGNPLNDVFNILVSLGKLSLDDGNLYLAALLYQDCMASPTGCPSELCVINPVACGLPPTEPPGTTTPEPTPTEPPTCPGPTITQGSISISIQPTGPNYPVAVGQDPDERGVDISASVTIPPVVYTWYEPEYEMVEECRASGSGTSNCTRGNGSPGWLREVPELVDCEMRQEIYPERITQFNARSEITPGSAEWIVNTLGAQWYGAQVKQASFDLTRFGAPSIGCGGGTCSGSLNVTGVPYADPGFHRLTLLIGTAGTPVSPPRVLDAYGEVGVWVILPTLIDANP
jgi:hypothetical protein